MEETRVKPVRNFKDFNIPEPKLKRIVGKRIEVRKVLDKLIRIHFYYIVDSKFKDKGDGMRLDAQIDFNGEKRLLRTSAEILKQQIVQIPADEFPIDATIIEENDFFKFVNK